MLIFDDLFIHANHTRVYEQLRNKEEQVMSQFFHLAHRDGSIRTQRRVQLCRCQALSTEDDEY